MASANPAAPRPAGAAVWWLGVKGKADTYPVMGRCGPRDPLPDQAVYWCREGDPLWTPLPVEDDDGYDDVPPSHGEEGGEGGGMSVPGERDLFGEG